GRWRPQRERYDGCARPAPLPSGRSRAGQGLQVKPLPLETGSVQSGPRLVAASGRVTNAKGPALCSPFNAVGPVNTQFAASVGLLNQKPMLNVFVGGSATSLSTPKIWSSKIVRMRA